MQTGMVAQSRTEQAALAALPRAAVQVEQHELTALEAAGLVRHPAARGLCADGAPMPWTAAEILIANVGVAPGGRTIDLRIANESEYRA